MPLRRYDGLATNLIRLVQQIRPTEIYKPRRPEPRRRQFREPGIYRKRRRDRYVLRLLEAIRILGMEKETRFYQASTSELYGLDAGGSCEDSTPFYPRSPYPRSRQAVWLLDHGRTIAKPTACSPRTASCSTASADPRRDLRHPQDHTRAVARIEAGLEETLYLGNLDAKRDWGHAKDYVVGMHQICASRYALTIFVHLATGETRSGARIRQALAFAEIGRGIEVARRRASRKPVSTRNPARPIVSHRPPVISTPQRFDLLIGDASKAHKKLGWKPKTSFAELVKQMVAGDPRDRPATKVCRREPVDPAQRARGFLSPATGNGRRAALVRRLSSEGVELLPFRAAGRSARSGAGCRLVCRGSVRRPCFSPQRSRRHRRQQHAAGRIHL